MSTSRRKFLKSSAVATLCAGISLSSPAFVFGQQTDTPQTKHNFDTPYEAKKDPVFYYTKSTFEPHLKTDFRVQAGTITSVLTLVAVTDCTPPARINPAHTKGAAKASGECFSILFHADRELSPLQTIHAFEHGALGKFSLFVSRVVKHDDSDRIYYEAIINRVQPQP